MKVALIFHAKGINNEYQRPLWEEGVSRIAWRMAPLSQADIAIMWGPQPELSQCRAMGKPALVIDFPYWNRGKRGGGESYKVSLNGQHPTEYVFKETLGAERNPIELKPWRAQGEYILIAGMGPKSCDQYGYQYLQWEKQAYHTIRKYSRMPIVFRPKPQRGNTRIPGCHFDEGLRPIEEALAEAYAVVCHHGNPGVDALANGVPVFTNGLGVASLLSLTDLAKINEPYFPENRQQLFNNLGYWQWRVDEIRSGLPLLSMRARGLI